MFGLFKKDNGTLSKLLDRVEEIQREMRRCGVYACIKQTHEVFAKLDDPKLKLTRDQESSISIYLDEIVSHINPVYAEVIKYECEQIIVRADKSKIITDKDEDLKALKHRSLVIAADLEYKKLALADLENLGGSEVDEISLRGEIEELEAKKEKIVREYEEKMKEQD